MQVYINNYYSTIHDDKAIILVDTIAIGKEDGIRINIRSQYSQDTSFAMTKKQALGVLAELVRIINPPVKFTLGEELSDDNADASLSLVQ